MAPDPRVNQSPPSFNYHSGENQHSDTQQSPLFASLSSHDIFANPSDGSDPITESPTLQSLSDTDLSRARELLEELNGFKDSSDEDDNTILHRDILPTFYDEEGNDEIAPEKLKIRPSPQQSFTKKRRPHQRITMPTILSARFSSPAQREGQSPSNRRKLDASSAAHNEVHTTANGPSLSSLQSEQRFDMLGSNTHKDDEDTIRSPDKQPETTSNRISPSSVTPSAAAQVSVEKGLKAIMHEIRQGGIPEIPPFRGASSNNINSNEPRSSSTRTSSEHVSNSRRRKKKVVTEIKSHSKSFTSISMTNIKTKHSDLPTASVSLNLHSTRDLPIASSSSKSRPKSASPTSNVETTKPQKRAIEPVSSVERNVKQRLASPPPMKTSSPQQAEFKHPSLIDPKILEQHKKEVEAAVLNANKENHRPIPRAPHGTSLIPSSRPSSFSGLREITVHNHRYTILKEIGHGGSSRVYQVFSHTLNELFAMKHVLLADVDDTALEQYKNEIALLKSLGIDDRIVTLFDYEVTKDSIYLIMELGETDLAHIMSRQKGKPLDIIFIMGYWKQMIEAVAVIHEANIVHSDLKPANFVIVRGRLKLIDFGIAKKIANDTTNIYRESQIGTLNYMSPEALNGAKGGQKVRRKTMILRYRPR
ncbi:Dual-specificity kinase, spindle pole body (SPB) duplication and spindle checkpoint function [Apophysomyces ossiformis]|uniref:Dual-specificity kinase, spindle pole body (SPB) duplication and spindle checkpoint function n=1 Tax=Apophysomyces ossiformis TaxID=679940 RepID=A0A8H7BUA3_9FUNG|nr:Dual-specificity kinase, spindle pole body (SPB) duplication and spindle checkpoint function [Apophysomyces ossiformis]